MADQKINELPTKTAPSTGDKVLMIGAAEEYQIDYDKLASAILNKLSTQFGDLSTIYIGSANLTLTNGASYITDPRIHEGSIILAQADYAPALSGALLTCSVQPMSGRANFYIRNMVDGSTPKDGSVVKINLMVFNK